jgi:Bacterial Ig domain/Dockerin type I domain
VARPRLEGLEDRLVLSLVAVSASDTKVNVSSPLGQTVPSVAMDANGDYVVAWNNQVHLGPNYLYDVEARVYNSAGVPQTGEIVVAQTTGDTRPSVAMDPNGDFVVAYQVLNITTYLYGVSAQRFNLAGQAQGGVITINDGSSDSASGSLPKVAIDSAGDFTIAYQGYDSNSHGVFAQQFNSSGTAQGSIFRVNTPQTDNQGAPSIAMDSAGNFVIAWLDGGTAQSAGVYAQRYNSSGVAQGGNTAISTVAGASDPSVAMEPTGQYVIAWQFTQTANTPGIEAQRFDAGGNALTGVVPLSSPESYFQTNPTVAIDSEGDFVVAWESDGVNGTASSLGTILAQRVNSGGSLIGPTQFLPSTETTSGSQTGAMIASNAGGNAIIVWQTTPAANTFNVFSRLYNYVNDAPTINTPSNVTINENAGQQTVNLTGITAGGGETQTLTVTASSNNTALINPSVTYTSPNSTGTLTFTPAANSFGTATITVTVMDNGGTLNGGVDETSVQFTVTVNQVVIPPTIDTPSNVTIDENAGEQTVNLTGITSGAAGNVTLTVAASSNNTALIPTPAVTYTSPNSTGTLTFTPTANTFGTATITVTVSDDGGANTTSVHFTVTVNQINIPPTIDTPSNVTIDENAGQQTVNLTGITSGAAGNVTLTVAASSNNTALIPTPAVTYTSPNSTGTLTFTPTANTFGTATITVTVSDDGGANTTSVHFTVTVDQVAATVTAVSADWGTSGTIALQTAADGLRLLPAGRNTDLPWYGINKLQITLSQAESLSPSDVSVTGITVANYGPVTISGSGTNYTITFAQAITTADRVTVTIGNAGIATYTRRLDVLPGDVNDDGVVNAQDLALVHNDFNSIGAVYNIFDDIDGSGVVDITDYSLVGRFVGKKLPVV